jgi:hypothetical protein
MPPRKWSDDERRRRRKEAYDKFLERAGILYPYYALMYSRQRIAADGMKLRERVNGKLAYTISHETPPFSSATDEMSDARHKHEAHKLAMVKNAAKKERDRLRLEQRRQQGR